MNETHTQNNPSLPSNNSNKNEDGFGILLPCRIEEFGEFVTKLIGKPQRLKGETDGVFTIRKNEVSNVYHLIDQRIKEQNEGSLAHFEIKVVYDNGTSISHKNIIDFESYYPTLPGRPEEIIIFFTYLIKFRNRDVPEKQEIEIAFSTVPNRSDKRQKWYAGGLIEWNINHTERTWASDMNGLLKNHAASCIESKSGFWKWLRRYYEEVSHNFGIIVFLLAAIFWLQTALNFLESNPTLTQLAQFYTISAIVLMSLYIIIGTIIRAITLYLIVKKESFICLIDKDETDRKKLTNKATRRLGIYVFSFILTISTGVIANIIYNLDWTKGL